MLIFERIMHARTSDSHTHNGTHSPLPTEEPPAEPPRSARRMPAGAGGNGHVEFDVELGELEEAVSGTPFAVGVVEAGSTTFHSSDSDSGMVTGSGKFAITSHHSRVLLFFRSRGFRNLL